MKIFMSHSGRQKLFVKELRRHLPTSMDLWIDERELRVGASVEAELESAVREASDFFIIVVDRDANESEWVAKEIGWAIGREQETGQTFLLPIVVEPSAWEHADSRIRDRKFLTVADFTDESIAACARALTSEIFQWLSTRLDKERSGSPGDLERKTNADLLRSADQLMADLGNLIKETLLPYRAANPITLRDLLAQLRERQPIDVANEDELYSVLKRLSAQHLLNGIEFDEDSAFLLRENFSYKSDLKVATKKQIARHAAKSITSNMTLAIDGGSTVLPIVEIITRRLRSGSLQGLNIITNFIPAAAMLLEELSSLGAGDRDRLAQVFLLGGLTRPVSLTTIPVDFASGNELVNDPTAAYDLILAATGPIDIAFLGANGMHQQTGLGTHNPFETSAKSWFIRNARRRFVLMDPSKLAIDQAIPFASWEDGLEIITAEAGGDPDAIAVFAETISGTPSTLEVLT